MSDGACASCTAGRGYLGVRFTRDGVVVEVLAGSPAERAELRPGMVVVEAGGKPVKSDEDLLKAIKAAKPGSVLLLRVQIAEGGRFLRALQIPE